MNRAEMLVLLAKEEVRKLIRQNERMRAALSDISQCNGGEGYMPELAKKALDQD